MDRRDFISLFGAGVAGIALEQAIPLGRVWSFPKEIVTAGHPIYNGFDLGLGEALTFRSYWIQQGGASGKAVLHRVEVLGPDGKWQPWCLPSYKIPDSYATADS
jgi:hypothetical protein